MYDQKQARDLLLAQDFEISMLNDLPLIDISPLI